MLETVTSDKRNRSAVAYNYMLALDECVPPSPPPYPLNLPPLHIQCSIIYSFSPQAFGTNNYKTSEINNNWSNEIVCEPTI